MIAYYNEIDPFAAGWLRNLIDAGLIPAGDVDERSIVDVRPWELAGYTQHHFFAGVGGWSLALRLAGWPDSQPVWTGSCPCPPFSAAGRKKSCPQCGEAGPLPCPRRTGVFICQACDHAWLADGRHLWPEFWRLIRDCRPASIFGEQVASKDGRIWLDTVRASLEILGYAAGGADLCAAGLGAPNIRQRLFWVADTASAGSFPGPQPGVCGGQEGAGPRHGESERRDAVGGLADATGSGQLGRWTSQARNGTGSSRVEPERLRDVGWLADADSRQRDGVAGSQRRGTDRKEARWDQGDGQPERSGEIDVLERHGRPRAHHGGWDDADWLFCTDGKWRPVEPGTQPLAHGVPARVGRLRAYGNAINPVLTAEFITAFREAKAMMEAA